MREVYMDVVCIDRSDNNNMKYNNYFRDMYPINWKNHNTNVKTVANMTDVEIGMKSIYRYENGTNICTNLEVIINIINTNKIVVSTNENEVK
jgi:hypothetical protein